MNSTTSGIHHITAIAADGPTNLAFYRDLLGLRMVKQTVNFDVPDTYHLYYGNHLGEPGTALTFFLWPSLRPAGSGAGTPSLTRFLIPKGSINAWRDHLEKNQVPTTRETRFGEEHLRFRDSEGMELGLSEVRKNPSMASTLAVKPGHPPAIIGFDGVELRVRSGDATKRVLQAMGYTSVATEGARERFEAGGESAWGRYVEVWTDPESPPSRQGIGAVHHVAFRAEDDPHQLAFQRLAQDLGLAPSPVMDRNYFRSIYFREPGGILFEVATDAPGFTVDEEATRLGETLKLPPQYEPHREKIEAELPPLFNGTF